MRKRTVLYKKMVLEQLVDLAACFDSKLLWQQLFFHDCLTLHV